MVNPMKFIFSVKFRFGIEVGVEKQMQFLKLATQKMCILVVYMITFRLKS